MKNVLFGVIGLLLKIVNGVLSWGGWLVRLIIGCFCGYFINGCLLFVNGSVIVLSVMVFVEFSVVVMVVRFVFLSRLCWLNILVFFWEYFLNLWLLL